MMTLDEAIKHAEEVANDMELCCEECAEDHRQLAEWLRELKAYKEQINGNLISKSIFDQIKWERDVAIEQLKDLGYELGRMPR